MCPVVFWEVLKGYGLLENNGVRVEVDGFAFLLSVLMKNMLYISDEDS